MEALFHIGYHKTGSTWLQKSVFPRLRNWAVVPRRLVMADIVEPRPFDFDAEGVRGGLRQEFGERVLLSEEELSGNPHAAGLNGLMSREVADRLHTVAPEARVLIFIREQIEAMGSLYVQYVKRGGNYGPRKYLLGQAGQPSRDPFFHWAHLDYWPLIRYYRELFGAERVHVIPYERLREDPQGLLTDLAEDLDWELEGKPVPTGIVNPGYGRWTLRLARFLNAFHADVLAHKYYLLPLPGFFRTSRRWLRRWNHSLLAGPKVRTEDLLDPATLKRARDYFRDSNAAMQSATGLDLVRLGYPV